ncbi:MAG: phage major capsid protein [Pirellulales bacterium]|nr:phage major capsid protein [Pirellulales bacterium]
MPFPHDVAIHKAVQAGRNIVDTAAREGRELTAQERAALDATHKDVERLRASRQAAIDNIPIATNEMLMRLTGPLIPPLSDTPAPIGAGRPGNRIDDAMAGWAKFAMGLPVAESESRALSSLGYSATAAEIELPLSPHESLTGGALGAARAGVSREVWNAMTTGSDTGGGYLVPQGFTAALERALLAHSGMLQSASVVRTTTGEELPFPTSDDTSNEGELLREGRATSEQDVEVGALRLSSYEYSSKMVRVQNQLMRDAGLDVGAVVGAMLGERLGRILNRDCTTGNGAARPMGIVTAATLGVTAASATAIAADEIIELVHSVDPAYRTPGCGFMMTDTVFKGVSLLKDGDGNYLMKPGLTEAAQPTLRGWPVVINAHMSATIAASEKVILFGQVKKYLIRQVGKIRVQRLVERYAEYNQTAFIGFSAFDAGLLDAGTHPVKYLQMGT